MARHVRYLNNLFQSFLPTTFLGCVPQGGHNLHLLFYLGQSSLSLKGIWSPKRVRQLTESCIRSHLKTNTTRREVLDGNKCCRIEERWTRAVKYRGKKRIPDRDSNPGPTNSTFRGV